MTQATQENQDAPVWARADAFPVASQGWGWVDAKGTHHPCASLDELISVIRDDRYAGVALVWIPGQPHLILPEEVTCAADAVRASRSLRAADDLLDTLDRMRWFGGLLAGLTLYLLYQGWRLAPLDTYPTVSGQLGFALRAMLTSMSMGITLLMFLIFAFIPWYQARKRVNDLDHWTQGDLAAMIPILRFETWLEAQKSPVTRILFGLLVMVALAQILRESHTAGWASVMALFHNWDGITAAGLVKDRFLHGEWWRLLTAPFVHGNALHFLMNATALLYLGKRLEVFARWPHVVLVFLFSAIVAGEASTRFIAATSVGASGGLMGWLGFLLVFESLHRRLVPRTASRRLLAGVLLTGLIGLIGYRFIDNAAHFGGLLAGMLYGLIVFPKSDSPHRPNITLTDRIAGSAAGLILVLAALIAVRQILTP